MKNKNKPKFNHGHFPLGTVVKVNSPCFDNDPNQEYIVERVHDDCSNGYILDLVDKDGHHTEHYNSVYVTEIVRAGKGKNIIDPCLKDSDKKTLMEISDKYRCHFSTRNLKNYYIHYSRVDLIIAVSDQFIDHTKLVDYELLATLLKKRGLFKPLERTGPNSHIFACNKKKLKRAIRQLLPKALKKKTLI